MKIKLEYVTYMPKELLPGILYVSEEFKTMAHLCACGCGSKIRTPLTPTEWELRVGAIGPSVKPSIGNWQLPCKSHYWISNGEIYWSTEWTDEQIEMGRKNEDLRRRIYYADRNNTPVAKLRKFRKWLKKLFFGK
jgi:hypothetical protein